MELYNFLERFLPDYDAKFDIAFENLHKTENADRDFKNKHFPEAIENYTNLICQKQRELCAEAYDKSGTTTFYRLINNAPQPKIEEI